MASFAKRLHSTLSPTPVPKSTSPPPLKLGILGAAAIAPSAVILPALTHPDVVVYAVAARSLERAQAFAAKWGVERAYGGYEELLDDVEVDLVYNPLPNGLHYEWTMKALMKGKHVLNEKPSANTAEETREMFALAERKGLVLLDAYHYRFHPAVRRVKEIVESGEVGDVRDVGVKMIVSQGLMKHGDIRFDYELGGGAMMDLGCYAMNCIQYMSSSRPTSVTSAKAEAYIPPSAPASYVQNIDRRTTATLALASGATASLDCDLRAPPTFGLIPKMPQFSVVVTGTLGSVELFNHILPTFYHAITVKIRGGHTRVEKAYKGKDGEGKGEEWWSSYRYQMEALVGRVRGREAVVWVGVEDSVETMRWIEEVYEKTGMGVRPRSSWVPPV
ncbi:hypothetical protein B0H34DRAFT_782260 [Crassisporium funariophilum]|nr:hypothetical protein B0H34DRAFT_782260 [Crassisporium funariophilum]